MVYVFVFLGEFGYELLNWQGRVRKFAQTLTGRDRIVCCSRASLYPLYEMSSRYIDLSELLLFRRSRASCYSATIGAGGPGRWPNRAFDAALRRTVERFVTTRLDGEPATFVFSSTRTTIGKFTFGATPGSGDGIYDDLDVESNVYRRIEPDLSVRAAIERRLGFDLAQPYVLVQTRRRTVGPQSAALPVRRIVDALTRIGRVVLLSFETGRRLDSRSCFEPLLPGTHYAARTFPEQACLVNFASRCIFLTEGDFGSHILVPPFMGKDIVAIAPAGVYTLGTTPIDRYNRDVLRFGGQIRAYTSEALLTREGGSWRAPEEIVVG